MASPKHCNLRIAVADIAADGPFSSYEGVERWIVVISGTGIALTFSDGERELMLGDDPLCFDGAAAPGCRLLDGPTRITGMAAPRSASQASALRGAAFLPLPPDT